MKKLCILLTALLAISTFSSCDKTNEKDSSDSENTNYTFLDDNAKTEEFIKKDSGYTSKDGAFTVTLTGDPVIKNDRIKFAFNCTNNTDYDLSVDLSLTYNVKINGQNDYPEIVHLVARLGPREVTPIKAGETLTFYSSSLMKSPEITDENNPDNRETIWNADGDNIVDLKYSCSLYVRMPDDLKGEKRAYNEDDEIDIAYISSEKNSFSCTLDKDGNIK